MAYTAKCKDAVDHDGRHERDPDSLPRSEATPQLYSPEHKHANAPPPPHCISGVVLPAHGSGYVPQWNAPTLHSSGQDQRYGMPVPYVNDMARGHSVLTDAQHSAPFAPVAAMNALTPYKNQNQNQDAGNAANGPMAYLQDDRLPASRDFHGWGTTGPQPGGVINYGPTLGLGEASAQSAAGHDVQFVPDGEAPAPSESLRTLTRRYVLDPGTRIETVNIGLNGCGRLKVTITLEAADGV